MDLGPIVLKNDEKQVVVYSWFGDSDLNEKQTIILEGDNSEVDVYGVFLGVGKAACLENVTVVHKGRNTRAQIFACGVALDQSFVDFSGMLRVERGATGTKTFFRANLMILSEQSKAHTFPGLEIEENDIAQGGHAATVGKVNAELLFYMMSRGLSEQDAKQLIIRGFFEPVLSQIDPQSAEPLRARLDALLG